jgi:hypothetical protein
MSSAMIRPAVCTEGTQRGRLRHSLRRNKYFHGPHQTYGGGTVNRDGGCASPGVFDLQPFELWEGGEQVFLNLPGDGFVIAGTQTIFGVVHEV